VKVVLTGANGYIGRRLLDLLIRDGHEVYCFVRSRHRLMLTRKLEEAVHVHEVDLLEPMTGLDLPDEFDAAYYLVHSMTSSTNDFSDLEARAAHHFIEYIDSTTCGQIIYLGGMYNAEDLSEHLQSRRNVEEILSSARRAKLTALRAGIIVGSGSASFEIIRDLVEKLPVMIAPRWLNTRCQPIAIRDVLSYLNGVLGLRAAYGQNYDIAGPDILTYREMLLECAEVRGMRRMIVTVPVMTPRLSSYWLYFVTRTSYKTAVNLVDSMKVEVVARENDLDKCVQTDGLSYKEAVQLAFQRIKQN